MKNDKQEVINLIGCSVRTYRLQAGLTQEALSEAANISEKNLSALENGRLENVSIGYIIDIANALNVDFNKLINS